MTIHLTIPGTARTKKNSSRILRRGDKVFLAPSGAFEQYQEDAGWYIGKARGLLIGAAVNVKCVYYMPTRQKVDLGNLIAATCDILVHYGVLVDDNSGIVVSHDGSRVFYDKANPRTEIEISDVGTHGTQRIYGTFYTWQ